MKTTFNESQIFKTILIKVSNEARLKSHHEDHSFNDSMSPETLTVSYDF